MGLYVILLFYCVNGDMMIKDCEHDIAKGSYSEWPTVWASKETCENVAAKLSEKLIEYREGEELAGAACFQLSMNPTNWEG